VLVADDDADVRAAIKTILEADGYEVMEAADGESALEMLARGADDPEARPDVVLLDFVMPRFSGLGILRVIKRFERVPPIVIMTAFPDRSVERLASALGAARVIRKPLEEDELRDLVLEACRKPIARSSVAARTR
jgi:two-component system, OmpR family, alkaline phosphatase synthesis response regulator PhoP